MIKSLFKEAWASWIISIIFLYISAYMIYLVGYYDILQPHIAAICFGIVYSFCMGWLSYIFATKDIRHTKG